jgi:predicted dehydrogenase
MTDRLGWGILGCGWIATEAIAPAIQWSNNGRLVAVGSRTQQAADSKARETGALRAYGSYEALLEDREIDAIYIGLPNGLHEEWALRCADAGKHVLCEKSLTLSRASAHIMTAAFASRNLRLVEAFMYRHHPQWKVATDLVGEGKIGEVHVIRVSFCGRFDRVNNHRWSKALGGGALWDLTCYGVNAARFVVRAEPVRAAAFADARTDEGVDASTQASLVFENRVLAAVTGSLRAGRDESVVIVGADGALELDWPFAPGWAPTQVIVRRGMEERRIDVGGANHYLHQIEHFASLVADPLRDAWPAEDGACNVAVCEAIEKSWHEGGHAVDVERP